MGCRHSTALNAEPAAATTSSIEQASFSIAAATEETPVGAEVTNKSPVQAEVTAAADDAAEPEAEVEVTSKENIVKQHFKVNGVSIAEDGVVFYHIESEDFSVSTKKRFNDFKSLYVALEPATSSLPPLPPATFSFFHGKHSQKLMKQREEHFQVILNAIANSDDIAQNDAFKKFLAVEV